MTYFTHLSRFFYCFFFCLFCLFGLKAQAQEIDKIHFKNSKIEYLSASAAESTRAFAQQSRQKQDSARKKMDRQMNIVKISPLTPIAGYITVGYERNIGRIQSVEAKLGIIGIKTTSGDSKNIPGTGFFGVVAYKLFIKEPKEIKNADDLLQGVYIRPEWETMDLFTFCN
jgi:hypothetical protein